MYIILLYIRKKGVFFFALLPRARSRKSPGNPSMFPESQDNPSTPAAKIMPSASPEKQTHQSSPSLWTTRQLPAPQ